MGGFLWMARKSSGVAYHARRRPAQTGLPVLANFCNYCKQNNCAQLGSGRLGSSWRSAASGGAAGGIIENRMARICRPRFSPDFQARRALKARDERMKRATNTVSFIARFQRTVIIIIIIIRSSSSGNNNMGIWRGRRLAD